MRSEYKMTALIAKWLSLSLGAAAVIGAIYLSFSNRAWVALGCKPEQYPEAAYLVVILPVALTAFMTALLIGRGITDKPKGWKWIAMTVSIFCSFGCIWIIALPFTAAPIESFC